MAEDRALEVLFRMLLWRGLSFKLLTGFYYLGKQLSPLVSAQNLAKNYWFSEPVPLKNWN